MLSSFSTVLSPNSARTSSSFSSFYPMSTFSSAIYTQRCKTNDIHITDCTVGEYVTQNSYIPGGANALLGVDVELPPASFAGVVGLLKTICKKLSTRSQCEVHMQFKIIF